ncbi:MAG: hypothetical protein ACFB21_12060 [Opitutales bacterium]
MQLFDAQGVPTLCLDRNREEVFQTPPVVHVGQRGALVSEVVERLLVEEPEPPVCWFAKLSMGRQTEPVFFDRARFGYSPEAEQARLEERHVRERNARINLTEKPGPTSGQDYTLDLWGRQVAETGLHPPWALFDGQSER